MLLQRPTATDAPRVKRRPLIEGTHAIGHAPIRLLYVTVSMPFGHGEQFLAPEALQLIQQGFDVLVVPRSPRGGVFNQDATDLVARSVRRRLLGLRTLASAAVTLLWHPLRTARGLMVISRSESLRVAARNALVLPKSLWLADLATKWHAQHIHAHWGRTTATMAMIASEITEIPWSLTLHRNDIAEPNILSLKMERAHFTRFISKSGVEMARAIGLSPDPARTHVIHMGVEVPASAVVARAESTGSRDPLVLCPAHLYPVKGHQYLISAMSILRDRGIPCSLWIAGEGHLLEKLQRQVDDLGLQTTIRFLGAVPHERILDWYRAGDVDVVALASVDLGRHEYEGIPVALMEAMAYCIPVISTKTGGIPELVGDGAGIVVPPEDPEALAAALEQLILDSPMRGRIARAGRARVEEQFNVERTTAELAKLIRSD